MTKVIILPEDASSKTQQGILSFLSNMGESIFSDQFEVDISPRPLLGSHWENEAKQIGASESIADDIVVGLEQNSAPPIFLVNYDSDTRFTDYQSHTNPKRIHHELCYERLRTFVVDALINRYDYSRIDAEFYRPVIVKMCASYNIESWAYFNKIEARRLQQVRSEANDFFQKILAISDLKFDEAKWSERLEPFAFKNGYNRPLKDNYNEELLGSSNYPFEQFVTLHKSFYLFVEDFRRAHQFLLNNF